MGSLKDGFPGANDSKSLQIVNHCDDSDILWFKRGAIFGTGGSTLLFADVRSAF